MKKYRTKKEKVYYELRDEIVQGSVAPGSRLTITSLAEKFEVSEIPVREAVQQLVQERYLVTAPHMGITVSIISDEDVCKTFEIRAALESLAARLSTRRVTEKDIGELYRMIDDSRQYRESADFYAYWLCNQAFHSYIYRLCGNERLIGIISDLMHYSHRYPQYYTSVEQIDGSIRRHLEIMQALSDRDEKLVEDLIRIHMIYGCRTVRQRVREANERLKRESGGLPGA